MASDAPRRKSAIPRVALPLLVVAGGVLALSESFGQSTFQHYFGNLHAHTSYSDGSGTPDEAYRHAKDHLDFIAITEHNHEDAELGAKDRRDGLLIANDADLYEDLKEAADRHNQDGSFVTFWGQEFSTISKGNHSNAFQVNEVITLDNGDYKSLYSLLGNQLLQFNHSWDSKNEKTDYGTGQFHGSLRKLGDAAAKSLRLIEVINGPGTLNETGLRATLKGEPRYRRYLSYGLKLAPTANQDNHYFTWGDLTDARTVVLAPELTRSSILQSLRAFRSYASTDKNLRITYAVNGRQMGTSFNAASRKLRIGIAIADDDEPQAKYRVQAVYGNPKTHESSLKKLGDVSGDSDDEEFELETEFATTFVYLRIAQHPTQASKTDMVVTAPIWITVNP